MVKTLLFLPETFIPYVKIYKTKYGKQLKRILDKRRLPVKRLNFFFFFYTTVLLATQRLCQIGLGSFSIQLCTIVMNTDVV